MGETNAHHQDVDVVVDELGERAGGAIYVRCPDGAGVVVVSPRLDRRARRWAVQHELAHHDLGVVAPPATPAMMQRAERRAEAAAVGHLVPHRQLEDLITSLPDGQGVTAGEVAEAFGVPVAVAEQALRLLVIGAT